MAKKNDDFFKEKKVWSEVKDELLGCYFKPYISKILHTYKPLVYVDCFAGKGKFDDGQPGSPIIALDIITECVKQSKTNRRVINANFIDLNYAAELTKNLEGYPSINVIAGDYEKEIENLLSTKDGCNVFLYIDPYGIKALKCSYFDNFANYNFNSIELLINMNSFGFFREACNALGAKYDNASIFEDLIEYNPTKMNASEKSIKELNEIAGGDYWQVIVEEYKKNKIDGYQAESTFAEQYCKRLSQSYDYVLNMPLRVKRGQRPKYRMIHATNHADGCLIMVDNIHNRWQMIQDIQNCGQISLWEENCENRIIDEKEIKEKVTKHFRQYEKKISLNEAFANFFVEYGAICSTNIVRSIVKELGGKGKIDIIRTPKITKKGKPSTFMTEGKGKKIEIRWLS